MLDGKRYHTVFPDETPEIWLRIRSLLGLLKKLENEFRPAEQFRVETPYRDGGGEPGFQES